MAFFRTFKCTFGVSGVSGLCGGTARLQFEGSRLCAVAGSSTTEPQTPKNSRTQTNDS